MRKEITMIFFIVAALIAASMCFRQIFARPMVDFLSYSYMAVLLAVAVFLLALLAIIVKRLLFRQA